jgi:hypothetical protein
MGQSATMINLPAHSGSTIAAFILADLLILLIFIVAAGPVFITGRDVYGRPLEVISRPVQLLMAVLIFVFAGYFALQAVTIYRFLPYYVDRGETVIERVIGKSVVRSSGGAPIAYWVTTERHRFGVTAEIYGAINKDNIVEARFRAVDDTLYEIRIVRFANGQPNDADAGPSPAAPGQPSD